MKTFYRLAYLLFFAACTPMNQTAVTPERETGILIDATEPRYQGLGSLSDMLRRAGILSNTVPRPGAVPLVVMDGIPILGGSLAWINPHDVATIRILKTAASTAIYGVRGGGGVILVTTKSR